MGSCILSAGALLVTTKLGHLGRVRRHNVSLNGLCIYAITDHYMHFNYLNKLESLNISYRLQGMDGYMYKHVKLHVLGSIICAGIILTYLFILTVVLF